MVCLAKEARMKAVSYWLWTNDISLNVCCCCPLLSYCVFFMGMRAYVVCCLTHWCVLKLSTDSSCIAMLMTSCGNHLNNFHLFHRPDFLLLFCWLLFLASLYTYTQIWWPLSKKNHTKQIQWNGLLRTPIDRPTDRSHSRASLFLVISLLKMFSSSSVYGTNTCIRISLVFYWEIWCEANHKQPYTSFILFFFSSW